jgi:hypothetical protein
MKELKPGPIILLILFIFAASCTNPPSSKMPSASTYEELVSLFKEWREFESPELINGVPDYSVIAMKNQHGALAGWQQRLNAFDTSRWPVKHQIDWYLLWAEMNGLDFDHRVRRPWSRDPAFYVWFFSSQSDTPGREGPHIYGRVELPDYGWTLSDSTAAKMAARLRKAPDVFKQAKANLTGKAKDLWVLGIRSIREQSDELESFSAKVNTSYPDLAAAAKEARDASNQFADWLTEQAPSKTEVSGVGKENFNWYLQKVHLVPYTWSEEKLLTERELYRAHSGLRLAEHRNRKLPKLEKKNNAKEYDEMQQKGVDDLMAFFEREEFLSVKPYMEPALRAQLTEFVPAEGIRGFFYEVDYRDPIPLKSHMYHWIELARNREEPNESPIRATNLLSNIFDGRAEGFATAMEELVMNAGLLKDRPRAEELVYIMLAQRCARGLGGLYQHGHEMDFRRATEYASKWVPWGLLPAEGSTIQHEEHMYLQQPAYEVSYVIGKIQVDQLIAEYARQREGKFVLKEFMDEFNRVGIIPMSLVYWQMTGDKSMVIQATAQR